MPQNDIVLGGKQFPNPNNITPVWDTQIPPGPPDKLPIGTSYSAEPYRGGAKMNIDNTPGNQITPAAPKHFKGLAGVRRLGEH